MPYYIVKLEDKGKPYYLEWSTIVDAPLTYGMEWPEFEEFYLRKYGDNCIPEFRDRMRRVEQNGISSYCETLKDLFECNRAADNETCLTKAQIIKKYIRERPKK